MKKTPPPKKKAASAARPKKTGLLMSKAQAHALKTHLQQFREGLGKKDQKEFDKGHLGKILTVL